MALAKPTREPSDLVPKNTRELMLLLADPVRALELLVKGGQLALGQEPAGASTEMRIPSKQLMRRMAPEIDAIRQLQALTFQGGPEESLQVFDPERFEAAHDAWALEILAEEIARQ